MFTYLITAGEVSPHTIPMNLVEGRRNCRELIERSAKYASLRQLSLGWEEDVDQELYTCTIVCDEDSVESVVNQLTLRWPGKEIYICKLERIAQRAAGPCKYKQVTEAGILPE